MNDIVTLVTELGSFGLLLGLAGFIIYTYIKNGVNPTKEKSNNTTITDIAELKHHVLENTTRISKITEEISKVATCIDLIENRVTSEVKVLNAKIDSLEIPKDKQLIHSKQFTDRLKLGPQLHKTLNSYRTRINADHIFIGSFHNGNESITGIPYYKFDIIAERFRPDKVENDTEFATLYKDSDLILHDLLPTEVVQQGLVYFAVQEDNTSNLSDIDDILYRRLLGRGIKQLAIVLTRDPGGNPSGFVGCVKYDTDKIDLMELKECGLELEQIYATNDNLVMANLKKNN